MTLFKTATTRWALSALLTFGMLSGLGACAIDDAGEDGATSGSSLAAGRGGAQDEEQVFASLSELCPEAYAALEDEGVSAAALEELRSCLDDRGEELERAWGELDELHVASCEALLVGLDEEEVSGALEAFERCLGEEGFDPEGEWEDPCLDLLEASHFAETEEEMEALEAEYDECVDEAFDRWMDEQPGPDEECGFILDEAEAVVEDPEELQVYLEAYRSCLEGWEQHFEDEDPEAGFRAGERGWEARERDGEIGERGEEDGEDPDEGGGRGDPEAR